MGRKKRFKDGFKHLTPQREYIYMWESGYCDDAFGLGNFDSVKDWKRRKLSRIRKIKHRNKRRLSMNNYEKLCGKNGELVAFRQKQVLLGAAEIIKRHCEKHKCEDCMFAHYDTFDNSYECGLCNMWDMPCDWELTTEKTDDFTE